MKKSVFMKRESSGSISPRAVGKEKSKMAQSGEMSANKQSNNNTVAFINTKEVTNEIIRKEIMKRKNEEELIRNKPSVVRNIFELTYPLFCPASTESKHVGNDLLIFIF